MHQLPHAKEENDGCDERARDESVPREQPSLKVANRVFQKNVFPDKEMRSIVLLLLLSSSVVIVAAASAPCKNDHQETTAKR